MSTTIEWTQRPGTKGETWNPVVGCTKVSQGCKHCYAKRIHDARHKAYDDGKLQNVTQYAKPFEVVQLMHERLMLPLKWRSPRTVFVNSVSDLFHEDVPFDFIDRVFAVMVLTPQHTYQIVTKRPERMAEYKQRFIAGHSDVEDLVLRIMDYNLWVPSVPMPERGQPLPNVWLGTSVEDQATADARIPHLLKCPAAVRFLSCEPLLGPVDLRQLRGFHNGMTPQTHDCLSGHSSDTPWGYVRDNRPDPHGRGKVDWVIAGGESGPKARPMHPDWARGLRDQCTAAGVPFFFKQWGQWLPSYEAGELAHDVANYGKTYGERWAAITSSMRFEDGQGMVRVGKRAAGNLLDGVEHNAYPSPR